jgi:hypothetical protein
MKHISDRASVLKEALEMTVHLANYMRFRFNISVNKILTM